MNDTLALEQRVAALTLELVVAREEVGRLMRVIADKDQSIRESKDWYHARDSHNARLAKVDDRVKELMTRVERLEGTAPPTAAKTRMWPWG